MRRRRCAVLCQPERQRQGCGVSAVCRPHAAVLLQRVACLSAALVQQLALVVWECCAAAACAWCVCVYVCMCVCVYVCMCACVCVVLQGAGQLGTCNGACTVLCTLLWPLLWRLWRLWRLWPLLWLLLWLLLWPLLWPLWRLWLHITCVCGERCTGQHIMHSMATPHWCGARALCHPCTLAPPCMACLGCPGSRGGGADV